MKVAAMLRPRLAHYAALRDGWLRNDEAANEGGVPSSRSPVDWPPLPASPNWRWWDRWRQLSWVW